MQKRHEKVRQQVYYLQLERKYRKLYNTCADKKPEEIDFKLTVLPAKQEDRTCYCQSFFSPTEIWFYLPMAVLIAVVIIVS